MAGGPNSNPTVVILTALFANLVIAIAKFGAFWFTRSASMLAEAFHSVADTGNQILMYIGLKRADKPADETHPYGYGKETYFWSFVVAISIFTVGAAFSFYEGTHKIIEVLHGTAAPVQDQTVGYIVLSISLLVEGYAFYVAMREFRRNDPDRTMREAIAANRAAAVVTVLFEDLAAVGGLCVALLGALLADITGNPLYDAIATLCIGVILAVVAVFLAFMTKRLLIGQSASPDVEKKIEEAIHTVEGVVNILELKTLHMGENYILLNLGIQFQAGMTTQDLEQTIDRIEVSVKKASPTVQRIFIEVDSFRSGPNAGLDAG